MRLIRQIPTGGAQAPQSSIDDVQNPQLLANSLLDLGGERSEVLYPSRLRVSMLHDVCVRQRVLGYRTKALFTKATNTSMQLTFDIGHAIHSFLQNSDKYFGVKRFGWWMCMHCGGKYFGRFPKSNCKECNSPPRNIQYLEHSIKMDDPYMVTGHTDCFLEVGPGDIRLADFKTITGEEFEKLNSPKGDHKIQVSAYMMLLELDKSLPVNINPNKGFVIYVSKKHTVKSLPIKAFHVERDPLTDRYIQETLSTFTEAIRDGVTVPPKHPQCEQTRFTCYRAKSCPTREECQRQL